MINLSVPINVLKTTSLNLEISVTYAVSLSIASKSSLEQRRIEKALIVYNLWGSGITVLQPSYNNLFTHNPFSEIIAHIWNSLPSSSKSADSFMRFKSLIKTC